MPALPTPAIANVAIGIGTSGGSNRGQIAIKLDWDSVLYAGATFTVETSASGGAYTSGSTGPALDVLLATLALSTPYTVRIRASLSGFTASPYATFAADTGPVPTSGADLNPPTVLVCALAPGTIVAGTGSVLLTCRRHRLGAPHLAGCEH